LVSFATPLHTGFLGKGTVRGRFGAHAEKTWLNSKIKVRGNGSISRALGSLGTTITLRVFLAEAERGHPRGKLVNTDGKKPIGYLHGKKSNFLR